MDVRLTEISVSRSHAKIVYHNDEFYFQDTDSKFETMVLIQKHI